jgi:hypothetical protein
LTETDQKIHTPIFLLNEFLIAIRSEYLGLQRYQAYCKAIQKLQIQIEFSYRESLSTVVDVPLVIVCIPIVTVPNFPDTPILEVFIPLNHRDLAYNLGNEVEN